MEAAAGQGNLFLRLFCLIVLTKARTVMMEKLKEFIRKYGLLLLLAVYEAVAYIIWLCIRDTQVWLNINNVSSLLLSWVFLAPMIAVTWYIAKKFPEGQRTVKAFCRPVWRVLAVVLALVTISSVIMLLFPGAAA